MDVTDVDQAQLICLGEPMVELLKRVSVDGGINYFDADAPGAPDVPVTNLGGDVRFQLIVRNIGTSDLVNVMVSDADLGIAPTTIADLPVGAEVIVDSGTIVGLDQAGYCDAVGPKTNVAMVTAENQAGQSDTATNPANVLCGDPDLRIFKEISIDGGTTFLPADTVATAALAEPPQDAEYRFIVENTSTVDLNNVTLNDATLGIANENIGTLLAGESRIIDKGDIGILEQPGRCTMAGQFLNIVTVSGESAIDGTVITDTDPAWLVCATPDISLDITKQERGPDLRTIASGDNVPYDIVVTNTSSVTLSNIVVTDPLVADCATTIASLAAGASFSYTCTAPNVTAGFDNEICAIGERIKDDGTPTGRFTDEVCDTSEVQLSAMLGDFVFEDTNGNGIQDLGEDGVDGVKVTLTGGGDDGVIGTGGDDTMAMQNTAGGGLYKFNDLIPGVEYKVTFSMLPAGSSFTTQNAGGDDDLDSDADPNNGMTQIVTLAPGEFNDSLDAGIVRTAMLGNYVWEDLNGNGQQDANEPGVNGVKVILTGGGDDGVIGTGGDDTMDMQATANDGANDGAYKFNDLVPGVEYKVTFGLPAGFLFTRQDIGNDASDSDADPVNGMSQIVTLASGEFNDTIDAGIVEGAMLGDKVFEDLNANGIQDGGEPGVDGVKVTLTGGGDDGIIGTPDDTMAMQNTAGGGMYKFNDLIPGVEYKVTFSMLPANFSFTLQDQGGDDTADSDADPANGMTQIVTLMSGEFNDTLDAGVVETAMLGNFVWNDLDNDGQQDANEPGVNGVKVTLTGGGDDGVIGTGGDDTMAMQNTANDGNNDGAYKFNDLIPGVEYKVTFSELPAGFIFTGANIGNDASDSDADPANGMSQIVTLGSGEFNDTLDAGLVETAMIGDKVFQDTNGNGVQDMGENGVNGVKVTLTGGGADGVIGTGGDDTMEMQNTTDMNGAAGMYKFNDLIPGVEYKVTFSMLPAGFGFTQPNQGGDDNTDSDADPANGMTQIVTLDPGEFDDSLDAGLVEAAMLGNYVWEDLNRDGQQGANEPGVNGVKVILTGGGADGVIGTGGDDTMAMQLTANDGNNDGAYKFNNLVPGVEYKVTFADLPAGFAFTSANVGNDASDSDANPANGMSQIVTLASGEFNDTIDAGIFQGAMLGNFVWEDLNGDGQQGVGEPGVNGVKVTLIGGGADGVIGTGGDDTMAMQDTANDGVNDGAYKFNGLIPGVEYKVTFSMLPAGFAFTDVNVGNDATDSDANPAMGGMTATVILASGEFNDTIDAGILQTAMLGNKVFNDIEGDGLQNNGNPGVNGVKVILTGGGADGVIGTGGDDTMDMQLTTDMNGAAGMYKFNGLEPGVEYKVTFTDLPAGFTFTTANAGANDNIDSDADQVTGMSQIVTLASGEFNDTVDAGLVAPQNCDVSVTKHCVVMTPPGGADLVCDAKVAATTLRYTGPDLANATVVFSPGGGDDVVYTMDLVSGVTVLTKPSENGFTIDRRPDDLGSSLSIEINGVEGGVHTSCSVPFVAGQPAPLNDPKGDPSPNWSVVNFVDKDGDFVEPPQPPNPGNGVSYCEIQPTGAPSCETMGKPSSLTFRYTGGGCPGNNTQGSKTECTGSLNGGLAATVTVDAGEDYLVSPAVVQPGDLFTITRTGGQEFRSSTVITLSNAGGTQENDVHTSCSADLAVNDEFGAITLFAFDGETAASEVRYDYTIINTGTTNVLLTSVFDDKLDEQLGAPQSLAPNDVLTLSATALLTETTTNVVTVRGNVAGDASNICEANADATVAVLPPPQPPVSCSDIKGGGITEVSLIWNGTETVDLVTSEGQSFMGVAPGNRIRALADNNDLDFMIVGGSLNGSSNFHVSCSDAEMNGSEDCGNDVGDGKNNDSNLVNTWLFDGMTGGDGMFACALPNTGEVQASGGNPGGMGMVTAEPSFDLGDDKKLKWELTNHGNTDVFIESIEVVWPSAHGMLKKMKLEGDFVKDAFDDTSPTSAPAEFGFESDRNKRKLKHNDDKRLEIEFTEKFKLHEQADFTIVIVFDTGQILTSQ